MELSGIPNSIPDDYLKNTVINVCKESGINVEAGDTEGCHWLPLLRNSGGHNERFIVKIVNRKNADMLLKDKKRISGNNFVVTTCH